MDRDLRSVALMTDVTSRPTEYTGTGTHFNLGYSQMPDVALHRSASIFITWLTYTFFIATVCKFSSIFPY